MSKFYGVITAFTDSGGVVHASRTSNQAMLMDLAQRDCTYRLTVDEDSDVLLLRSPSRWQDAVKRNDWFVLYTEKMR